MALTVQDVELGRHYPFGYGDGAKAGYRASVTLQLGERSYDKIAVELPPEATKAVIALIVAEAMKTLTVDADAIDVVGGPGAPKPEPVETDDTAADVLEPL